MTTTDTNSLGQRLLAARTGRAMTLKDVESATEISAGNLSRYERDLTLPSAATMRKLARFYGIPVEEGRTIWVQAQAQRATEQINV